jgi:putative glutamine amidotransferase
MSLIGSPPSKGGAKKNSGSWPLIGITAYEDRNTNGSAYLAATTYIQSILQCGGIPIIIPQYQHHDIYKELVKGLDGILFTGGEDVSPLLYGQNPVRGVEKLSNKRDHHEIALVHIAKETATPILGICRGMQLINVALGGTLIQDIATPKCHNPLYITKDNLYHWIKLETDSILFNLAGSQQMSVNSLHHQAVDQLADELRPTAYSEDGILEACQSKGSWYIHGVQFHPEALLDATTVFKAIFQDFIQQCKVLKQRESRKSGGH